MPGGGFFFARNVAEGGTGRRFFTYEDRDRHLDAGSRARDRIAPPFCFASKCERCSQGQSQGGVQPVRAHETISGSGREQFDPRSNRSWGKSVCERARNSRAESGVYD